LSINKRKILQSAQRFVQKGAFDKALKDYQTLLEADPKDVNLRLKVGDLYLRLNKNDDAVTAYLKVADRFMKDGFDAKAVALYKQITRIDQKRVDVYVPLAELYQRLGLTSDAMGALQTAADAHYREGNKPAALELLRKMATLDPSNTTSRLKVAELLRQEGMKDEALTEFEAVAAELERQGEVEGRVSVLQKVIELDANRLTAIEGLGRCYAALRKWSQAEELAQRLIAGGTSCNVEGYEILAEACQGLRRDNELQEIYRSLVSALRERGEEDRAREIAQRFTSGAMPAEVSEAAVIDSEEMDAAIGGTGMNFGEAPIEEAAFITDSGLGIGDSRAAREERDGMDGRKKATSSTPFAPPPLPPIQRSAAPEIPVLDESEGAVLEPEPPAADADQLLAEASVYLRYGKHERAIESLRGLLAREPDHRRALEKLGEACAAAEQPEQALEAFRRAAELAVVDGDTEVLAELRLKAGEIDPAAAEALGAKGGAPAGGAASDSDADEFEIEIDDVGADQLAGVGDDEELGFDTGDTSEGAEPEADEELSFRDAEVALDATPPPLANEAPPELELIEESAADSGTDGFVAGRAAPDESEELEFEIDVDESEGELAEAGAERAEAPAEAAGEAAVAATTGGSSTTPREVLEGLEEAELFLGQGMLDEAETVCHQLLEVAPSHPKVLLRLGEVAAARAEALGAAAAVEASRKLAALDEDSTGEVKVEVSAPAAPAPVATPALAPVAALPEPAPAPAPAPTPEPLAPVPAPAAPLAAAASETDADSGDFDLAAEIEGDERAPVAGLGASAGTEEEGFLQVFAAFKAGVEKQLGAQDFEARFDLGIAYKEMGLFDDALGEFRVALQGPNHKLQCLHMMGLCALDLGRGADAVAHLEQALALPDLPADQQMALRFDLGRAYEAEGDRARARAAWEAVAAHDPDFCDVREHLAGLDAEPEEEEAEAGEAFESFDDLMSESLADEAEAAPKAKPAESYESFEDFMGGDGDEPEEAEDETQVAEITAAEVAEAEEEDSPAPAAPPPEPHAPRGPKRRKKISFV
jgi:tetratricopeptide (TPR) repeat protein